MSLGGLILLGYGAAVILAFLPHEERPRRELTTEQDHLIQVDGVTLRYREHGDPAAPALVLLHGFANSLQTWRDFAPRAAAEFRVISVDMPGYGLSDKPVQHDYHNDAQGELIGNFIDALGLEKVVVGGHSLGGAVAVHTALGSPRVSGLVLFNPGILSTGVPAATGYLFFPLQRLSARQFANRAFRESLLKRSYLDPTIVTPAVVEQVLLGTRMRGYMEGMAALMDQYESGAEVPLLRDLNKPTLIVWGKQDRNKPAGEAHELQARIAGSRLRLIDDAGHYVHEERPGPAAGAVLAERAWLLGETT